MGESAASTAKGGAGDEILSLQDVSKTFGKVTALSGVSLRLRRGEVHCLLGDNGAGKSTLIKILAGAHQPTSGRYLIDGRPVVFDSPKGALDRGIATVYQDLALIPLLSVARNFFLGREPRRKWLGLISVLDLETCAGTARDRLAEMGIDVRDPHQPIGTMSGGERQCVAIARAIHFGARVLILDEPTAALGVRQSLKVLKMIHTARSRGISVIFITHNVHHAYPIGDSFTLLNRGQSQGTFTRDTISKDQVLTMMAGGADMQRMIDKLAASPG